MTNDYETTMAFEKYEEIFWKRINKEFDLEDMSDDYKLLFFCTAPSVEEMNECIDSDGYLCAHEELVSAEDGFADTTFNLVANYPDKGGFEISLDSDTDIDIDAYEGVKGYYYNGRFYNDYSHSTNPLPYMNGHYHFDWTNYDPTDVDNDYGIVTYYCDDDTYTSADKPEWIDFEGNIIVKVVFLVKDDNDFVMGYCRFSTPLFVRDVVTLPVGSKFISVGECTL